MMQWQDRTVEERQEFLPYSEKIFLVLSCMTFYVCLCLCLGVCLSEMDWWLVQCEPRPFPLTTEIEVKD